MLALIIAALAAAGVLLVFFALAGARPMDPVQARLSQLGSMQARTLEEIELQQPFFERTLRPLAGACRASRSASPAPPRSVAPRSGCPWPAIRATCAQSTSWASSSSSPASPVRAPSSPSACSCRNPAFGFLGAIAIGGMGFMFPEIWLSRRIKKRQKAILLSVPDTLDLLTISVRAGLSFDGALAKVVEKTYGPLADEFRRALAEIRVGKARRDALSDIRLRTEVPALSNFIAAIIQAEQLGVPIAKVLQVQSEQLRIERRQRAEEMAAKAPIKMLFPLVGCIFPSMFIVILGPAIILIMLNMQSGT